MCKRETILWFVLSVLAILIVGLTGCSGRASIASSTASLHPTASAVPSATATLVTATTVAAMTAVPAAATNGWAIYRDSHVAFQVPLPPGWRSGSFMLSTSSGPANYIVQFFPPHSYGQPGAAAASMEPELIQITVVFASPYVAVGDPQWIPETHPVAIGNTQSVLYDRMSSFGQELERLAATRRGTVQFVFNLHELSSTTLDTAKINSATSLYLGMLQGFQYLAT